MHVLLWKRRETLCNFFFFFKKKEIYQVHYIIVPSFQYIWHFEIFLFCDNLKIIFKSTRQKNAMQEWNPEDRLQEIRGCAVCSLFLFCAVCYVSDLLWLQRSFTIGLSALRYGQSLRVHECACVCVESVYWAVLSLTCHAACGCYMWLMWGKMLCWGAHNECMMARVDDHSLEADVWPLLHLFNYIHQKYFISGTILGKQTVKLFCTLPSGWEIFCVKP